MGEAAASARDQGGLTDGAACRPRLAGISHRAYEHPSALTALAALRRAGGLDAAAGAFSATVTDASVRQRHLASAVRTGPRQLGCVHALLQEAAATLDLPGVPDLYVRGAGDLTAVTLGLAQPFVVLGAGLLDLMTPGELRFIIGRELGHALAGHALYQTMALTAPDPLPAGLPGWCRLAALSADRAGLLAAQDPPAAQRALLKLAIGPRAAGLDIAGVLSQAAGVRPDAAATPANDPMLVLRAAELDRWIRAGAYGRIISDAIYESRDDDGLADVCDLLRGQRPPSLPPRPAAVA